MIWDPVERLLWGMAIAIMLVTAFIYFRTAHTKEKLEEQTLLKGFAGMFFFLAIAGIFDYLSIFQIDVTNINDIYYGNFENPSELYKIFNRLYLIFIMIGLGAFFLGFEFSIKRTKFLVSIMQLTFIVFLFILPYEFARFLNIHIFFIISAITSLIILFLLARWSRLELKAVAALLLISLLLVGVGSIFAMPEIKTHDKQLFLYIPTLFNIAGALIAVLPLLVESKYFTKALIYWKVIGLLVIGFFTFLLVDAFIVGLPINFVIQILIFLVVMVGFFINITQNIKKEMRIDDFTKATNVKIPREGKGDINVLEIFTKPKKLTEQEVTLHKEKKICLVCKGKVLRFNSFICECDALYCEKCARTLSDMENFCWVCGVALDDTKPVKSEEEGEKKLIFEEDLQKSK